MENVGKSGLISTLIFLYNDKNHFISSGTVLKRFKQDLALKSVRVSLKHSFLYTQLSSKQTQFSLTVVIMSILNNNSQFVKSVSLT